MFNKASPAVQDLPVELLEAHADLLFEIGKGLLSHGQFELADEWLHRSHSLLDISNGDPLSPDGEELRISILQCRVHALISQQQLEALAMAKVLVEELESRYGDKLVVLLLKLELFTSKVADQFDGNSYAEVLGKMMDSLTLTTANFKLIVHHARKLYDKAPSIACRLMDGFVKKRLCEEGADGWLEVALVNLVWMYTTRKDDDQVVHSIQALLETAHEFLQRPLTSAITHALQTVSCASISMHPWLTSCSSSGSGSSQIKPSRAIQLLNHGVS
jgi:hypothetical protein